jgi:hypothetical protein
MKNALDQSFKQHDFPHLFSRRILMTGLSIATILFVLFLIDIFYIQFPLLTRTGDAQLQRWIGPDAVKIAGILIGLLFGICYLLVAIRGTRERETAGAWKLGASMGGAAGIVVLLLFMITSLSPHSLGELLIPVYALYGFTLIGSLVVGFLAGESEGQISTGTIAGFWFGTILALVGCLSILARDMLFAQHLASTVWLNDQFGDLTCKGAKGSTLIGCEVGDDVGFTANILLLLPLLGLLPGTGGGVLGHLFTHKKTVRAARSNAALVAPLICMGFLLLIFLAEALWNLW